MRFDKCAGILSCDSVSIFLLHGVVEQSSYAYRNFNRKHILAEEFDYFLKSLKSKGTALTTNDLIDIKNGRPLPQKSFVITFDDGFKNNLTVAAPILEKYHVPATFYITSDFVSNNTMSWIDRIDWAIEQNRATKKLEITLPWDRIPKKLISHQSRLSFLKEVRSVVKSNRDINQSWLADNIQQQLGFKIRKSSDGELDAKLTWDDVRNLASSELFTIGGHTHTHPIMSFLNKSDLKFEISHCLELLGKKGGILTEHFAYPEGLSHCYNDVVINCLKSYGIKCCPTAEYGLNKMNVGTDLFRLKRIFVD